MGLISYSKFLWDLLGEPAIFSFHDLISPQFDENCKLRLFYWELKKKSARFNYLSDVFYVLQFSP